MLAKHGNAHELIGWEARVTWQLLCLAAVGACSAPLFAAQLGLSFSLPAAHELNAWLVTRNARELTGFLSGGVILFQASLGVAKRLLGQRPLQLWRTAHQILPIALLFVALLHTRGSVGVHLNRWLISVLLLQIYLVQSGHLMKAFVAEHASNPSFGWQNGAVNGRDGVVHRIGLHLHVLLAMAVLVLLATHVGSIYYF